MAGNLFGFKARRVAAGNVSARRRPARRSGGRFERLEERALLATFDAGNLVVFQAASATLNNTTGTMLEISPTLTSQTAPVRSYAYGAGIRFSGSASSTGYVSRSADGTLVTVTGAQSDNTSSNANTLTARAVLALDANPANTTFAVATTYTGTSSQQTRSATTLDGSTWVIGDQAGIYNNNATAPLPTGNIRNVRPFGGTLYVGQASTSLAPVSTLSAAIGGTITGLPGLAVGTSAVTDFYLVQSGSNGSAFDVLYVTSATSGTAGTVAKHSLVNGTWVSNGTYATNFGGFGLAALDRDATNVTPGALLFVTSGNGATATNTVRRLVDAGGFNEAINVTTVDTLFSAATGTTLKGIDFAPSSVVVSPSVAATPTSTAVASSSATLGGDVTATGGSPITERGVVYALTAANPAPEIGGSGVVKVADATAATGVFTVGVTGLTGSSGYSFRSYATNAVGTTYSDVATFTTTSAATAPTVASPTATGITNVSATLGGTVTGDGDSTVIERGIVLAETGANADPTIGGSGVTKLTAAGTTGTFTLEATGLTTLTGYSYKAFATNAVGTTYTSVATFTTITTPTVSLPTQTSISFNAATLGGTVDTDGTGTVTERGVVYSLTTVNADPVIGGAGVTKLAAGAGGLGTFTTRATGLAAGSGYTFKAYATNAAGTTYTTVDTFTTVVTPIVQWTFEGDVTTPAVGSGTASLIGGTTATFVEGNPGQAWNVTTFAAQGTGSGTRGAQFLAGTVGRENISFTFDSRASGTASRWAQVDYTLDGGTTWVTGFWNNAGGLSPDGVFVSSMIDFSSVAAANNNPGFGVRVVSIFSPLAFNQNPTLSYDANTAYMRANTSATYAGTPPGTSTSNYATTGLWRFDNVTLTGDRLPAVLPTVTTPTFAAVTPSAATLGGNVTSDGFAAVTERGVVYALTSVNANPEIGGTGVVRVPTAGGTGVFSVEASGLTASSGYTFRAYAINSVGTAYSSTDTFTTLGQATAPSVVLGSPATSGVTGTAASLFGDVTSDGGSTITERGFVYSVTATNADPVINGSGVTKVAVAGTTGALTTDLTGLDPAVGYSFKAFATNAEGTTYTSVATFSTLAPTETTLSGISPLTTVAGQTVTFSGTVTATAGSLTPAGTVEIRVGGPTGTLLASTTTIGGSGANGTFSIQSTSVPIGTYSGIQAFFVPGSGFAGSGSSAFGGTLEVGIAPFTPGNLLVLRVGDGTNTLGTAAAAVSLLEITPAGAIVQTIPVTSAGGGALTLRGDSTTEGILTISGDRQSVTFGGYRADALTANVSAAGTAAPRVIGRVDGAGAVNTAQAITGSYLGDSFRSVATDDGTNFWLSGAGQTLTGGVRHVAGPTATTSTELSELSNTRQVAVLDGNLFAAAGGGAPAVGAYQIGLGLPTEGPQTLASAGLPTTGNQYQSFYYADLDPTVSWRNTGYDTLYVTNSNSGGLNLRKFSFVITAGVGSWADSGTINLTGASNVAGFTSGGNVTLYVTTSTTGTGGVQTLTDTTGYNGNFSSLSLASLTSPVTAGANYAFRGLAFVPRTGVATTTTVTAVTPTTVEQGQPVTFTATVIAASGNDTPTGSVQFRSGTTVLATAALTGSGATGTATVTTSSIPFGTYANITAQYVPDGNPSLNVFNPSTSAPFGTSLVVEQPGVVTTTTLVTMSPTTVAYGEAVTFTGAVTTADSSSPVGTLEIRSGGPTGLLLGSTTTFGTGGSYTVVTSTPIPGGVYSNIAAHFVAATGYKNSSSAAFGQSLTVTSTQLTAGGIAFTGFQATNPDKMSFVLLADVIAGTQIVITDNAWTGTVLTSNEGNSTITFTQAFQAGTVFDYESGRPDGQKWQHGGNGFAGGSAVGISDVTTSSLGLNASGDNLFAYQGAPPTSGTSQGWIAAFSSLPFLTEGLVSSSTTYLPAALTIGDTAFSLNLDTTARQDGGINDLGNLTNTAAGIRGTVYTPANWTAFTVEASVDIPSPTQFTIGSSATPAIGTTGSFTALVTPAGTASSPTTITVAGSNLTEAITATAPAGFEVSSDGTTYGPTATFTPASGVASGTLSLRLAAATAVGSYAGSVSLASAGATTVEVPVPAGVVTSGLVQVTGLFVRGSTWANSYLDLDVFTTESGARLGWGLRDGANQLATSGTGAAQVTWTNVNRISVRFNQPIATPALDALKLIKGSSGGESGGDVTFTPTAVTMLAGNTVAQFSFAAALETGQYVVAIAAGGIFDAAGTTVLDGEWTNGTSTFAAGSGDGVEGGSFDYRFNVVAGDANANGAITGTDRATVAAQLFKVISSTNYRANLDGSASINGSDALIVSGRLFRAMGALPNTPVTTAPAVTAPTVAAVTATTAELGGRVAGSGGNSVTERGIVLLAGASGTPVIGGPGVIELLASGTMGTFSVAAGNLTPSTTYRFRAFARNALGISYSEIRTFTTGPNA